MRFSESLRLFPRDIEGVGLKDLFEKLGYVRVETKLQLLEYCVGVRLNPKP